jgi:hypothetical protein
MSFLAPTKTADGRVRRQASIAAVRAQLPDAQTMAENVEDVLARATAQERAAGLGWYVVAHEHARELSAVAGQDDGGRIGAGILAALSPQTGWTQNVAIAYGLARDPGAPVAQTQLFEDRARAILFGDGDPYFVLGGRKVRSFFGNISAPLRSGPVTVDRHAVAAAVGWASPSHAKLLERPGAYQLVASAYRAVARRHGMRPHEVQAIVWLVWRREKGIVDANTDIEPF